MATGNITKRTVDALAPGARDVFLWDEKEAGFGVKITPAAKVSYVYQYRMGGRGTPTKRWTIGSHGGAWTAATARTEAERLARLVGQGIDPVEDAKRREREAATLGFAAYVETFTEGYLKTDWGDSWPSAKRYLEMHVVPVLGDLALPKITVSDLNPVFDKLRDRPATQRNVYAVLRKLFNWADKRDDIAASPMARMDTPAGVKSRKRVLSLDELFACWHASFELQAPRGALVRLLMITLQRRSEVAALPWTELSHNQQHWLLPGERSKNRQDHVVPLSEQALAEFDGLGWKRRGLVMPCSTGITPVSNFSDMKKALDKAMLPILQKRADERADAAKEDRHEVLLVPWRLHDLRRTGTTNLQALGFPIEVGERVINHHEGGEAAGIRAVYNLYEYLPEKTRALAAWGALLGNLVSDTSAVSNVVTLSSAPA
jgi:integrase